MTYLVNCVVFAMTGTVGGVKAPVVVFSVP
jgi:hypothetical protein